MNGAKNLDLEHIAILPAHMRQPEGAPRVEVVDAALAEGDLKVRVKVEIHGHNIHIMDCDFEAIVCGGMDGKNRGTFCQSLEGLLDHARRSVAVKVNSTLPVTPPTADEIEDGNNHSFLTDGHRLRLAQA